MRQSLKISLVCGRVLALEAYSPPEAEELVMLYDAIQSSHRGWIDLSHFEPYRGRHDRALIQVQHVTAVELLSAPVPETT